MRENCCRCRGAEKSIGVIFPQFSRLDAKIMIEKEVLPEKEFLRSEFKKFGLNPEIHLVSIEPADAEIQAAVNLAKRSDLTILFCYDAHLYPSNQKLLDVDPGCRQRAGGGPAARPV